MLYSNHPHFINPMQQAPEQKFTLYADELDLLAKYAKGTGKKEMAEIMQAVAQYARMKAQRSNGPVTFIYK